MLIFVGFIRKSTWPMNLLGVVTVTKTLVWPAVPTRATCLRVRHPKIVQCAVDNEGGHEHITKGNFGDGEKLFKKGECWVVD